MSVVREPTPPTSSDDAVKARYASAAHEREQALCCPVSYDPQLLANLPQEIIEKDYGCGDPSAFVRAGDVVVDLGSGGGKICYMASQLVGPEGRVIGVDVNQEMLALARKYQAEMADKIGYANVDFRYGRIQDLALDLDVFAKRLDDVQATRPERSLEVLDLIRNLRSQAPMIPDNSVDCVISNCVLNLVHPDDRKQLFQEVFRVLKKGGRAVISDIVSDEDVPTDMQQDGHLWSGCISGAWREDRFVDEFVNAGFYGVQVAKYQVEPWQVVQGIEFRSATIIAYKGKQGAELERNQAVIYLGPFEQVKDDDNNIYKRGCRMAVSDKTFQLLMSEPYAGMFQAIDPLEEVPSSKASKFDLPRSALRDPQATKGRGYNQTIVGLPQVCEPGGGCC